MDKRKAENREQLLSLRSGPPGWLGCLSHVGEGCSRRRFGDAQGEMHPELSLGLGRFGTPTSRLCSVYPLHLPVTLLVSHQTLPPGRLTLVHWASLLSCFWVIESSRRSDNGRQVKAGYALFWLLARVACMGDSISLPQPLAGGPFPSDSAYLL